MKTIVHALLLLAFCASVRADERTKTFLKQHCIRCHGDNKQKADRRFDTLPTAIKKLDDLERYQEIVDQLNLGNMPPEDEAQPTVAERAAMIAHLTGKLTAARAELNTTGGHSVLRRLNAWEYRQTIGDLLGLNVGVWNPAEDFPEEVKIHGFDNNGAGLVTSGRLMDHYFSAAEEAIRRATQFGARSVSKKYAQRTPFYFRGNDAKGLPKLFQTGRFRFVPETPYTDLYGRHYRGGHIGFLPLYRQGGVPRSGIYTIRVRAAAVGRVHDYGKALGDFRNGDPLVMEIAAVDRRGSVTSTGNVSKMISLARIELTNEEPKWFEWQVYMEAGYEPEVRFRNGPLAAKRMVRVLTTQAAEKPEFKPFINMKPGLEKGHGVLKAYKGPRLRVWEIGVEGPHVEDWPSAGHRALYGDLTMSQLNAKTIPRRLEAFAEKAFRRPVTDEDIAPYLALAKHSPEGIRTAIEGILCSPRFLYLREPEGALDHYAIASRLSYFLWNTMPDAPLLADARAERLRDPKVLAGHLDRMLADPRSNEFVDTFLWAWLKLDNTVEMAPDPMKFYEFRRNRISEAMVQESTLFFRHALDLNLPPTTFLDADFTFLNANLARHYGMAAAKIDTTAGFRKVSLVGQRKRGGLLGQAAVLTASANGVDTSPVVRGIWILENLLGTPPKDPPPEVEVPEPDARGELTIRELYAKHRTVESCNDCHKKIDPLGFALENFDAVGAWRVEYESGHAIDSSGRMPNGKDFTDVGGLKQIMIAEPNLFTRNLTAKLLTYAIGRTMETGDRPEIDRIAQHTLREQAGLKDLLRQIITSELFLNK